ncbi:MAG: hypothetical protein KIT57_19570 [Blastocatellales bacterium]|nr:hypothetical protein [Blastocatellales bacterium]
MQPAYSSQRCQACGFTLRETASLRLNSSVCSVVIEIVRM